MAIEQILDLEQLEVNIYRGSVFSADSANWQRTFGGHVAGQSLVSAVRTVDPRFLVHSLHGYFLRPGDAQAPTVFLVEPLRDGGSFCTRRVNAIQHGETIFSMSASFQTDQSGIEHQDAMPSAPPPDDLPGLTSMKIFDDAGFRQFDEWDVRMVPQEKLERLPGKASQQQVWFRHRDPLPDDPVLHICALAYMSDLTLLGSAQVIHLEERRHLQVASLDHAMWFMRPFRADEWLLYDQSSPSAGSGRSLTQGKIFTQHGEMVAAVMQEGLNSPQARLLAGAPVTAGDDAERSDEEERRFVTAGDDAERSDEEERRFVTAGDDAERSDEEERRFVTAGDDAERSDEEERRFVTAGDDAERSDEEERRFVTAPRVGVLALQGDTREHLAALREVGADSVRVRRRSELDAVDGLVIPGGESTTMSHLLRDLDLLEPLRKRLADGLPAYGACAGMILLASEVLDAGEGGREALPLGGIDMTVRRNAFGRQVDSFEGDLAFTGLDDPVHAVFIRAPWVERCGPGVQVLARAIGHVVAVRQGPMLATAFHPEMTGDRRIHRLFVDIVRGEA